MGTLVAMPRLYLNLFRARLQSSPAEIAEPTQIDLAVGDPPFEIELLNPDPGVGVIPSGGTLQFIAKAPVSGAFYPDFDGAVIVSGSVDVDTALAAINPQIVSVQENWKAAALIALFTTDQDFAQLYGEYRWRANNSQNWQKSPRYPFVVRNTSFTDDFLPGGTAPPTAANRFYLDSVVSYVGTDTTALDHFPLATVASGSLLDVVVNGVLSTWKKVPGTNDTDTDSGIIKTVDFDNVTNPYILVRVGGL